MEEKDPTAQAEASSPDEDVRDVDAAADESAGTEPAPEESPEDSARPESAMEEMSADDLALEDKATDEDTEIAHLRAKVEAAVYITEDPLTAKQLAEALEEPSDKVAAALDVLVAEYELPVHGLVIRQVAEGYKMGTKAEYHDSLRSFVKKLQKPLKLSMAALETLAVVAYKQPITAPEIMEIRGVQGAGVLKTLLERKLITTAGRKAVVGKPMLYRTTKEFLVQFGLNNVKELPTLKEFEELARIALAEVEDEEEGPQQQELLPAEPEPEMETEADTGASAEAEEASGPDPEEAAADPKGPQSENPQAEEPGEEKRRAAPEE